MKLFAYSHTWQIRLALLIVVTMLPGCMSSDKSVPPIPTSNVVESNYKEVLNSATPFIYTQANNLIALDPLSQKNVPLTRLSSKQVPPTQTLSTFALSPNKRFIVWYTAAGGLFEFDAQNNTVSNLEEPNDWFNSDPKFYDFLHTKDATAVYLQSADQLVLRDLQSRTSETISLKNSRGPSMVVSPNDESIIIIEGFNQTDQYANYTIATITDGAVFNLSTKTEAHQRFNVAWSQDSQRIVVIEQSSQLTFYRATAPHSASSIPLSPTSDISKLIAGRHQTIAITADNNAFKVDYNPDNIIKIDTNNLFFSDIQALSNTSWLALEEVRGDNIVTSRLWLLKDKAQPSLLIPEFTQQAAIKFPESNEADLIY